MIIFNVDLFLRLVHLKPRSPFAPQELSSIIDIRHLIYPSML